MLSPSLTHRGRRRHIFHFFYYRQQHVSDDNTLLLYINITSILYTQI
jgi:hypothetical protein